VSARSLLDVLSIEGTVGLGPSTFGGLRVDTGAVDGRYANRSADIRRLAIAGPDLRVDASGFIALGSQGQSSLTYELAAPSLDRLGRLFGQTLAGSLTAAGRVTGNGDNLRTTGTLKGLTLGYAGAQALAAVSQYDAELPGLDPAKAIVRATTSATFVQVAGQQIDDVTATTTYASRALDVDATLRQPGRQMRAAGNLVLHPDHQDVQLRRLGLQSQGVAWEMAPGTQAAIRYTGGTIDVGDIRLVNGTQQISVEGRIAPEASRLQVRLSAVDLAGVGALVIGDRGFAGQLDAEATITGPRDALAVVSRVTIAGGAFRQFTYQSLTGTVNYARDRVELDVRLDERPGAWIVATGSLPLAFLRAPMPPAAASLPVSLRIQSSPLDLGIVQGFTSAVQKVTGTLSLEAQLAGTAGKPTLTGHVDVANGSFTVPATGVAYRGLDGRLLLQSDRVTVERLSVTDEHGASLNVAGDLAVQERELGALNLRVRGRSFEVVHNTFGRLQLNPDLTVGGQIRQPHVTGTLAVDTGSVNLDPLLEMAASSAYATSPAQLPSGGGAPPANRPAGQPVGEPASVAQASASATPDTSAAPAAPSRTASPGVASSPFDAASLDLHITVPDDLVIKGTDIRLGQESLGLGNLNLTIGGDVRVEKASGRPVRLLGQVQTIRGTYDFQGRRFDVQRGGTVRFEGGRDIDPSLDITGTQLISGVEARVRVSGTARKPALTFASNPPLEQADVLSLIMFGQPANQLGAGQQVSLAQRAGALATGFVAARLTQSIGSALNLDTFEIQAGSAVTGQTGATVTLGQQVGQRLYVKVRQGVGGEGGTLFILEYQLTNFLRFQSTMSQGGTAARNLMRRLERSGADLILAFSF
jgi:translocation and assembly module TamB